MLVLLPVACTEPSPGDRPVPDLVELGTAGMSVQPPSFDPVVRGDVVVRDQADLDRLRPYAVVEGDLFVESTGLSEVELPYLREVGGEVRIWENPTLEGVSLPSLEGVGGDLSLYDDPRLTTLDLGSLEAVGGSLVLNRLPGLVDVEGLGALRTVGRLYVFHDEELRSLDGLRSLEVVDGPIQIWEDYALRDLRLPALRQVTGKLDLFEARQLEVLELPALTALGALELHQCDALVDLRGALPSLRDLQFELVAKHSAGLASLDGLQGLRSAGSVRLEQLPALADTGGLSGLARVRGELAVVRVNALTTLGLDALEEVGGVEVRLNAALADPGLAALRTAAGLRFEENPALPDCAVEALVARVDTPQVSCEGNLAAGCDTLCTP